MIRGISGKNLEDFHSRKFFFFKIFCWSQVPLWDKKFLLPHPKIILFCSSYFVPTHKIWCACAMVDGTHDGTDRCTKCENSVLWEKIFHIWYPKKSWNFPCETTYVLSRIVANASLTSPASFYVREVSILLLSWKPNQRRYSLLQNLTFATNGKFHRGTTPQFGSGTTLWCNFSQGFSVSDLQNLNDSKHLRFLHNLKIWGSASFLIKS